jgi:hypothetical protein
MFAGEVCARSVVMCARSVVMHVHSLQSLVCALFSLLCVLCCDACALSSVSCVRSLQSLMMCARSAVMCAHNLTSSSADAPRDPARAAASLLRGSVTTAPSRLKPTILYPVFHLASSSASEPSPSLLRDKLAGMPVLYMGNSFSPHASVTLALYNLTSSCDGRSAACSISTQYGLIFVCSRGGGLRGVDCVRGRVGGAA